MGFCFFTENTTLNIHSLGLNVGQLVHCICIGGGGGGGGGAGLINLMYTNRVNTANATMPNLSANGGQGGTGGITSFGNYISANGGGGGAGGVAYTVFGTYNISGISYGTSAAGGTSKMDNCNGGYATGKHGNQWVHSGTSNYGYYTNMSCGGGGGGFGEYVYKSFTLQSELIPVTIGARGAAGAAGPGRGYNFYNFSTSNTWSTISTSSGGAGGAGGCGGKDGSSGTAGGGGSGFGSGGGGGGGRSGYKSNTAGTYNGGGAGGGAGGYFIGEQRIYNKAAMSSDNSTAGGASGISLDYTTLYPASGSGVNGRTYPVLNKAGSGLVVLMW